MSQCFYAIRELVIGAAYSTYDVSFGLYEMCIKIVRSHKSKIKWSSKSNCGLWYDLTFTLMSLFMFNVALITTKKCYITEGEIKTFVTCECLLKTTTSNTYLIWHNST